MYMFKNFIRNINITDILIIFYLLDNEEIIDNPNLHPEEQDEFEIPEGNLNYYYLK
jgi:hypothetical protein